MPSADSGASPSFRIVPLPERIYRVARKGSGDRYTRISPADDRNPKGGGRFDVLGGGVLYVASQPRTCFLETLAPLRPSEGVVLKPGPDDSAFLAQGQVPGQWREDRTLYELEPSEDSEMKFVDLSDTETRTWLFQILEHELRPLGVQHLDVPEITHADRGISRTLARVLYSLTDDDGVPMFGGIRYTSKYDNAAECWAIFERFPVVITDQSRIDREDVAFESAAKALGLTVF